MTRMFAHPAPDHLQWKLLEGSLVVIQPIEVIGALPTQRGIRRATRANVFVVDGPKAGTCYRDVMIFPGGIQRMLTGCIGKLVLGRVATGKAGKDFLAPPWLLLSVADDPEAVEAAADAIALADDLPFTNL